jgi:hypothetical protein
VNKFSSQENSLVACYIKSFIVIAAKEFALFQNIVLLGKTHPTEIHLEINLLHPSNF